MTDSRRELLASSCSQGLACPGGAETVQQRHARARLAKALGVPQTYVALGAGSKPRPGARGRHADLLNEPSALQPETTKADESPPADTQGEQK